MSERVASEGAVEAPPVHPRSGGRLLAWIVLVGLLALASYGARLSDTETPADVLYLWSTFAGALMQYAIMLVLILAIARGPRSRLLALEWPASLKRAAILAAVAFGVILATAAALGRVLDAGEEQGLVPDAWDGSRAVPFLANALVVVLVAPLVEELLYREDGKRLSLHGRARDFQRGSAPRCGCTVSERFDEIRNEIVTNDRAIISAVNHRLDLVAELWELKAQLGLDTVDPDRERQLRAALAEANTGRLSTAGLERLVTDLLDLTKRELDSR